MIFQTIKILADENISPKVVAFLRSHGIDVLDTKEQSWFAKKMKNSLKSHIKKKDSL